MHFLINGKLIVSEFVDLRIKLHNEVRKYFKKLTDECGSQFSSQKVETSNMKTNSTRTKLFEMRE